MTPGFRLDMARIKIFGSPTEGALLGVRNLSSTYIFIDFWS